MSYNEQYGGMGRFSMFPPVIKSLLIINVLVFFIQNVLLGPFRIGEFSLSDFFVRFFYLIPLDFPFADFYPWQLITYQFIHGNFWHLFFNLFVLWMFGIELENMWGATKFIVFYLLAGIGAGLVQLFISPLLTTTAPTIGASGSIYGVMIAFAMTFPERPIYIFPLVFMPIRAKFLAFILIGIDLISGMTTDSSVAHFAHLGGALTGFILLKYADKTGFFDFFTKIFNKKKDNNTFGNLYNNEAKVYKTSWFESNYSNNYNTPVEKPNPSTTAFSVDGEEITQSKIDEILDKISSSGYQNLSEREKKILFELSQKLK